MPSGGGNSTTTVQEADPWDVQQPYLKFLFEEAQKLYAGDEEAGIAPQTPQYYPDQTVAPYAPAEQHAQRRLAEYSTGAQAQGAQQANAANQWLIHNVMNPETNSYLQAHAQGAIDPVMDRLQEDVLPQIQGRAIASGVSPNGAPQQINEALAIDRATENAFNTTADIYSTAYGQNLEAAQRSLALAPSLAQMPVDAIQNQALAGQMSREYTQALIDADRAKWNFEQQVPWDALGSYQALVQGAYGGQGTAMNQAGSNAFANVTGAALTGLGTYGMLTGPAFAGTALAGPAAPFIAGGLAIASLFS